MSLALRYLLVGVLVLCAAALFLFDPQGGRYASLYPPCPFHELTGLYCPGCGSLRAIHDLLHGRVLQALDHNALVTIFLPLALWYFIHALGMVSVFPRVERWSWHILSVVVLFWVLRNLPFAPFSLLAP